MTRNGNGGTRPRTRRDDDTEVSCFVKYTMFGFNVFIWLVGTSLVAAGVYAWWYKGTVSSVTDVAFSGNVRFDPAMIFIIVGGVMFLLGFSGCVGALRENICLLKFFFVTLGLLLTIQIVLGALAYFYKDLVKDQLKEYIQSNVARYRDDVDMQNIIDSVQQQLECCGGESYNDWDANIYFKCTDELMKSVEACGVPFSCCINRSLDGLKNMQCGYNIRDKSMEDQLVETIHIDGCVDAFENWMKENLVWVAGVCIGVAVLQIVAICFAINLMNDIKRQKTKWYRSQARGHI